MNRIICSLILLLCCLCGDLQGAELKKVARVDNRDITQLFLSFDATPEFSARQDKRRIDLVFNGTKMLDHLELFEADASIVKILPHQVNDKLILSLYFRYRPQKYSLVKSEEGIVVFDVLLGNEYSASYQNLSQRLKGLRVIDRQSVDFSNPYIVTPYVKDWSSFFSQFESPVTFKLPIRYTTPPFPIIRFLIPGVEKNLAILREDSFKLADQGLWQQLSEQLIEQINNTNEFEALKMLALTYGEVLMRSGDFEGAFKQLYLLKDTYKDENIGTLAYFLLIHLRALYEDPFIAEYEYSLLEDSIGNQNPFAPYFLLARIEAALVSGKYQRMNELLQIKDIGLPYEVQEIIRLREADYWYTIDQSIKAYAAYKLVEDSSFLSGYPYSLGGYSSTLYSQKKYGAATSSYRQLANIVEEKPLKALATFREKMARLKISNDPFLVNDFFNIETAYPGTEAGFRAALKKTDLLFLQDRANDIQITKSYEEIENNASHRAVREEALLKRAVVLALSNKNGGAITLAQRLLREFRSGNLTTVAQALLIDLLPAEIKRLVDEKEYIKALVLAKQNRKLFQNNWLDSEFLVDIAQAYHKVGIYDEAHKLYLYLIEIMEIDRREDFYLPMIQATFDHGNLSLVEDYAAQYTYNYPNGKYKDEILSLRLQALVGEERMEEAFKLLPTSLPDDPTILRLASSIFYRKDKYSKSRDTLSRLKNITEKLSPKEKLMLGESLFRTDNFAKADELFSTITAEEGFYEQSLYRQAEVARHNGDEEKALQMFQKIIDTGQKNRWVKYAERELQYAQTRDRI